MKAQTLKIQNVCASYKGLILFLDILQDFKVWTKSRLKKKGKTIAGSKV